MSTIILTTGVPGAGKTYVRASRFIVDDFLFNSSGVHYSNFPLNVDLIAKHHFEQLNKKKIFSFLHRRKKSVTIDDIKKRIVVIPDSVLLSWRKELSGPWDYFKDIDLRYCHIALDEIHEIIKPSSSSEYVSKWDEFLGTIRHRGCTIEGLTQDIKSVHDCFKGRAALRYELVPLEDVRDPFLGIRLYDYYQLKASFTGDFHKSVVLVEFKKNAFGRFIKNHQTRFLITPEYFPYYNSFSSALSEGESDSDRSVQYEYERLTKIGLLWWFISRNCFPIISRFALFALFIWLCFGGGIVLLINGFMAYTQSIQKSNSSVTSISSDSIKSVNAPCDIDLSLLTAPESDSSNILSDNESKNIQELEKNNSEKADASAEAQNETESDDETPTKKIEQFLFLSYLSPEYGILINGDYIFRGMKFVESHYHGGKYVSEINYKMGFILLSDGTALRLLR